VVTETVNLKGRNSSFQTNVEAEALQNSLRIKTPGPIALSVDMEEHANLERSRVQVANKLRRGSQRKFLDRLVLDGKRNARPYPAEETIPRLFEGQCHLPRL
jgi:hypothetical protein